MNFKVFDGYGDKDNYRFFLYYAFVIKDNVNHKLPISIEFNENSPNYSNKLKSLSINTKQLMKFYKISEKLNCEHVKSLLSFIRFITYDGDFDIVKKVNFFCC